MAAVRADRLAPAAKNAASEVDLNRRRPLLALGVMAPAAVKRTALHKDDGPYARAVVQGITLYFENAALARFFHKASPFLNTFHILKY